MQCDMSPYHRIHTKGNIYWLSFSLWSKYTHSFLSSYIIVWHSYYHLASLSRVKWKSLSLMRARAYFASLWHSHLQETVFDHPWKNTVRECLVMAFIHHLTNFHQEASCRFDKCPHHDDNSTNYRDGLSSESCCIGILNHTEVKVTARAGQT